MATRLTQSDLRRMAEAGTGLGRARLTTLRLNLMDEIINSFAPEQNDKIALAHASDGLHLFVNGEHKGYFENSGRGLTWRDCGRRNQEDQ